MKHPRELREQVGITVVELANRLGIGTADVLDFERQPLWIWEIATLREYLEALGYRLELAAVAKDGTREDFELPGATP